MAISVPNHIQAAGIQDDSIRYAWDDWKRLPALETYDDELVAQLKGISQRATLAFICGTAEWIIHRFAKLYIDSDLAAYLEAAWARIVHVRYGNYDSLAVWHNKLFSQVEWSGPVKKPIADAMQWVGNAIEELALEGNDPAQDAGLIATLACYVMTDPTPYKRWCAQVTDRFESIYPRNPEDRLGDVVPRQAVEPEYDFKIEQTELLINQFLGSLDFKSNIFLSSPEEMLEEDEEDLRFIGIPYAFNIEEDRQYRRESS